MTAMIANSTALFRYQGKPIAEYARASSDELAATDRRRMARYARTG